MKALGMFFVLPFELKFLSTDGAVFRNNCRELIIRFMIYQKVEKIKTPTHGNGRVLKAHDAEKIIQNLGE